jgi:hypothetical protein
MGLKWNEVKKKSILRFKQDETYSIEFEKQKLTMNLDGAQLHTMIRNHRQNVGRGNAIDKVKGSLFTGVQLLDSNNKELNFEDFLPEDYEKD